jgi:hypothetical protein
LWVYNDKVKPGAEGSFNITIGLPNDIKAVSVKGGLPILNNNTGHMSIETLIKSLKLKTIQNVINLPYIDSDRYKRAYEWITKLKKINKKIQSKDLILMDPADLQKIPEVETISEDDPIQIALSKQSVFGKGIVNIKNLFFAGNYDVKNSAPLNGKVSTTINFDESNGPLYRGTLKKTSESADPDAGSTIKAVDFETGYAISYPIRISNLQNVVDTENTAWLYTGNISNGRLASETTGTSGQLQIKINNILYTYTGTFKNNLAWDGSIFIIKEGTAVPMHNVINGKVFKYTPKLDDVYSISNPDDILFLKSEMKTIFKKFIDIFQKDQFEPFDPHKSYYDIVNKFISSTELTDKWDAEMENLVVCLNSMLYVYFVDRDAILTDSTFTLNDVGKKNLITKTVRKWIFKYQRSNLPTPRP